MRFLPWLASALILAPGFAHGQLPEPLATVLLSRKASPEVHDAANQLADLIKLQFGERPSVRLMALWDWHPGIRIGPDPDNPHFDADPLTDEVLLARDARGFQVLGSDNTTTLRAIGRFAESQLGWQAFQPGALGMELADSPPAPPKEGDSPFLLVEKAGFLSRNPAMENLAGSDHWEAWHGLRERFHYNHSLHAVIPPVLFDSHPDWFAKDAALRPKRPPFYPHVNGHNDHPDLSHPALRAAVASSAIRSLQQRLPIRAQENPTLPPEVGMHAVRLSPGLASLSISLGDAYAFGSFPETYDLRPQTYFRRWQDWSAHVFDYSNAVAAEIEAQWNAAEWLGSGPRPQLRIGVLAYLLWENVPEFPLHPSIVPFLTYDRSQWHDPAGRADDLETIEAWGRTSAPFLATWDYLFGYGFLIPRSLTGVVRDSIPALHERGVQAYFSQVCPVWPYDGHTNWLTAQLLWNPTADSDALLATYFDEFHGPAGPAVRSFMDRAEKLWMEQTGSAWWLRYWKDPWQAALWSPDAVAAQLADLQQARLLLSQAPVPPSGDPQRFGERLQRLEETFALTTAFLEYQWAAWDFQTLPFAQLSADGIADAIGQARALLERRKALVAMRDAVVAGTPGTAFLADLAWVFRYDATGGSLAALALRAGPGSPHQPAVAALVGDWARLAGRGETAFTLSQPRSVLHDPRFAKFDNPRIWYREFMDSEGLLVDRDPQRAHTVKVVNARRGHFYQLFKAEPGGLYLGQIEATTSQTPAGDLSLIVEFFDAAMQPLTASTRSRLAPPDPESAPQTLHALATAPPNSVYGRLKVRFYELEPDLPVWLENPQVLLLNP